MINKIALLPKKKKRGQKLVILEMKKETLLLILWILKVKEKNTMSNSVPPDLKI